MRSSLLTPILCVVMAFAFALAAADARADGVTIDEKPDHTTEASVTVEAAPAKIYELVTNYAAWTQILHDVKTVKVQAGGRGDAQVRFLSNDLGHEVSVKFENVDGHEIRFHSVGAPHGVSANGSYVLEPLDGGARTKITATFYLNVRGAASMIVSSSKARTMRQQKLRDDLGDIAARFAHPAAPTR
jgi:uncharacterized membrane protein